MGCEFDRPLDDSSASIMTTKDVANGKLRDHYDLVRLKVVLQFAGGNEQSVEELLHLRVLDF